MIELRQTRQYEKWYQALRDLRARMRIDARIRRLSLGNPGNVRAVGEGVSELRIDYGPGYPRVERGSMTIETTRWDVVEHLDSDEAVLEYMAAVLEDGDPALLVAALGDVAKARGFGRIAKDAGLSAEELGLALRPDGHPDIETVLRVIRALGIRLTAVAAA